MVQVALPMSYDFVRSLTTYVDIERKDPGHNNAPDIDHIFRHLHEVRNHTILPSHTILSYPMFQEYYIHTLQKQYAFSDKLT